MGPHYAERCQSLGKPMQDFAVWDLNWPSQRVIQSKGFRERTLNMHIGLSFKYLEMNFICYTSTRKSIQIRLVSKPLYSAIVQIILLVLAQICNLYHRKSHLTIGVLSRIAWYCQKLLYYILLYSMNDNS